MSYVIRKIQIKTTTIFQNTPVREAQTQNTDSTKCWWGCGVAETLTLLVEIQNGMAIWEDHLEVSYKAKHILTIWFSNHCCCCSVARSCPTLFDPMDFSMPGFPVLHYLLSLLKLISTESVMLSNQLTLCPQSFPASGSFSMSWLFESGGWSTKDSVSASVLQQSWSFLFTHRSRTLLSTHKKTAHRYLWPFYS